MPILPGTRAQISSTGQLTEVRLFRLFFKVYITEINLVDHPLIILLKNEQACARQPQWQRSQRPSATGGSGAKTRGWLERQKETHRIWKLTTHVPGNAGIVWANVSLFSLLLYICHGLVAAFLGALIWLTRFPLYTEISGICSPYFLKKNTQGWRRGEKSVYDASLVGVR